MIFVAGVFWLVMAAIQFDRYLGLPVIKEFLYNSFKSVYQCWAVPWSFIIDHESVGHCCGIWGTIGGLGQGSKMIRIITGAASLRALSIEEG